MAKIKSAGPHSLGIIRRMATFVVLTEYSFDPRAIELRLRTGCKVKAEPKDLHAYHITFDVYSDTDTQGVVHEVVATVTKMEEEAKEALKHQRALASLRDLHTILGMDDDWELIPPDAPTPPPPPEEGG